MQGFDPDTCILRIESRPGVLLRYQVVYGKGIRAKVKAAFDNGGPQAVADLFDKSRAMPKTSSSVKEPENNEGKWEVVAKTYRNGLAVVHNPSVTHSYPYRAGGKYYTTLSNARWQEFGLSKPRLLTY